jgi:hypothetical protein
MLMQSFSNFSIHDAGSCMRHVGVCNNVSPGFAEKLSKR